LRGPSWAGPWHSSPEWRCGARAVRLSTMGENHAQGRRILGSVVDPLQPASATIRATAMQRLLPGASARLTSGDHHQAGTGHGHPEKREGELFEVQQPRATRMTAFGPTVLTRSNRSIDRAKAEAESRAINQRPSRAVRGAVRPEVVDAIPVKVGMEQHIEFAGDPLPLPCHQRPFVVSINQPPAPSWTR